MKYGILDYQTESSIEDKILDDGCVICYACSDEQKLPNDIEKLDAVSLWHNISLTKNALERLTNCKVIVRIGVGYDNVDIKTAGVLGIPVVNIPDYGTNDVADHTFALMLAAVRNIPSYSMALREKKSNGWLPSIGGEIHRLTGLTLGIIGIGRIGSAVALRAKAFGMNVAFYDPYVSDGYDKTYQCKRFESVSQLMKSSDIVTIHAPLTNKTDNLINKELLQDAKPGMILINTARGKIVNSDDVYYALKNGVIRFFAADVLQHEPPRDTDLLFRAYLGDANNLRNRILLTPHSAFFAQESREEMRRKSAYQMKNGANGIALRNCVNKEFLVNPRTSVL